MRDPIPALTAQVAALFDDTSMPTEKRFLGAASAVIYAAQMAHFEIHGRHPAGATSLPAFGAQIIAATKADVLNAWSRAGLKHPARA